MSTEVMELFNIFSKTYTKEEAQTIVNDIERLIDRARSDLATKHDLTETELRLTKEIEQVRLDLTREIEHSKTSTIKWVVGWMVGLLIAQTGAIVAMTFLK